MVQVITSDYLNSNSSVRDRRARIVVVQFQLGSLQLDQHARDKFIRLLGDRSVACAWGGGGETRACAPVTIVKLDGAGGGG